MPDLLKDKTILVVGLGLSGQSSARFLLAQQARVVGYDDKVEELRESEALQNLVSAGMELQKEILSLPFVDFVVVSPGIPPSHPIYKIAEEKRWPVIGEVELACRYIKGPLVAVTGTNGKTTVALLVAHILEESGIKARTLGNIGVPLSAALECQPDDDAVVNVLELSSFQLETLTARCLDAAVVLNITPDHLDRYPSMNEYANAKFRILDCLKEKGLCFLQDRCAKAFNRKAKHSFGESATCTLSIENGIVTFQGNPVFLLPKNLRGEYCHEVENLLAAYAICRGFGVEGQNFLKGYETFRKPPHRLEFIRSVNGVSYINDSKGTNIDAVAKAVQVIPASVLLIAGGVDKGASYRSWVSDFGGKVRKIFLIGEAAEKIYRDLYKDFSVSIVKDLEKAVKAAAEEAQLGEFVLLSPGCSSFDMFKDYAHRGNEFKRIVGEL